MVSMTMKPLTLGLKKTLIVEPELDTDGDLEFTLDTVCDYSGHYVFLSHDDQVKLRDHLDALLKEHEDK
jgi:hypothetical protein